MSKISLNGRFNQFAKIIFCAVLILTTSQAALALRVKGYEVPDGPNLQLTPGDLCEEPSIFRYDEQIKYCERNVSSALKKKIFEMYESQLGFQLKNLPRSDFKIDHFIPLSIGGSNDIENLWPQHKEVYAYSDKLEELVYIALKDAKIKQEEAIRVIKDCKLNLDRCSDLEDYIESLH